jgi:hypothetical protein
MIVLGIATNISAMSVHAYVQSGFTRDTRNPYDQLLAQSIMVDEASCRNKSIFCT